MKTFDPLRYPIGPFAMPEKVTVEIRNTWISIIAGFPEKLKREVSHLSDEQLDTPYRTEGWTIRQVTHHCADSHMNALIRLKLTLTEDKPIVKPYEEALWAELKDSTRTSVNSSLLILEGMHERWAVLAKGLTEEQYKRVFIHPEHGREISIDQLMGIYAWHSVHHLAHITTLKQQKGWE